MKDKQIIELYLERSKDAIKETESKYGWLCTNIANHILENTEETELCVKKSMELLWDTIPPHRPQNLKAYLCKITRNQALQMKYPECVEQEANYFDAELVIYDFLKGLEPEQRKIFVAHYWYFLSAAEITLQYKISENKVEKALLSLHQKLNQLLEEKEIQLRTEELYFAMTEIEDRYLEEAEPMKGMHENHGKILKTDESETQDDNVSMKDFMHRFWNIKSIAIIAAVLFVVLLAVLWPKKPVEQDTPITTLPTEDISDSDDDKVQLEWDGVLIHIVNGDYFTELTFEYRKSLIPWNKEAEVAALPVYKNLAYTEIPGGGSIFLDEDTLVAMVEDIATKVDMQVIHKKIDKENFSEEFQNVVSGITATTDKGAIEIKGDGQVYVSFFEGVQLPKEYEMTDSASIEEANKIVNYLLEQYADLFATSNLSPNCYDVYDNDVERHMKYQAVARTYGADGIGDYYFNQVEFEYNEQLGLTGIRYGDVRRACELLGYYPIISVEEAKQILVEGNALGYDEPFARYEVTMEDFSSASYVELMYYTQNRDFQYYYSTNNKYYQPFYCFYVKMGSLEEYCRYYVPAVKGATEEEIPVQDEVTILDMSEYEVVDGMYHKDDKYYVLQNGEIVETEPPVVDPTEDPYMEYGEVIGDIQDNGAIQWNFYYKGELLANLEHLTRAISSINPTSYEARYVDGNIVIICRESRDDNGVLNDYATVLMYLTEDGTIRRLTDAIPMRSSAHPYGLNLVYDIYATMGNEANEVQILDLTTGESVDTGILYEDIEYIANASKEHFAILYKSGKIAVVEKASGQIVKTSKYQLNFNPTYIQYKDGMLYVEDSNNNNVIFVLKDFE